MSRRTLIVLCIVFGVCLSSAFAEQTPPMLPKIQETLIPSPVELTGPPSVPADLPNRPLTAEEAALIALHHQPSIAAAHGALVAAQGRARQVRSGELPTIGVSSGYSNVNNVSLAPGSSGGGTPGSSATGIQVGANLRQLIFDFNHTRDLVAQAAAQERSANAGLTKAESDLVFQVKLAFYTYAQDVRLVAVNEANYKNQQSHRALAQARLKAGVGLPSDVVRAETAVADAVFSLNLAQNNASVARVGLAQLMGVDPRTPVAVSESGERQMVSGDLNAMVDQALRDRPEMIQAIELVNASKYAVGAAKTGNSPTLSATAGWSENGKGTPLQNESLSAGITLSWSIFDSGFTSGAVKSAKGNLETSEATLASTRLVVISDVSQAYLNLKTAEQRLVTAQAEVANAEEGVRLSEGRYRTGLGTFLDVVDAQTALVTANTNRVNAQSSVDQARASLAHATGKWSA